MVQCNRGCNATGLHWRTAESKFRLFDKDNLMHICNDGVEAHSDLRNKATDNLLSSLGLDNVDQIECVEPEKKYKKKETLYAIDAKKPSDSYFTITGTATGIAITGDDKKNPIYLPKIAVKELTRALFDFF
jgi:hypothetical protein